MKAMKPKRDERLWERLIYIDPLCGPGKCISRQHEFPGSPLIALQTQPAFDYLYFSDSNARNISALKQRIPSDDHARSSCQVGDCNQIVPQIIQNWPQRSLGLAFIDPEGFEVNFSVLVALSKKPIDILYFFPSMIGVKRNLRQSYVQRGGMLDGLLGPQWRNDPVAKVVMGKQISETEMSKLDPSLLRYLRRRAKSLGLVYQDEDSPVFRNEQNAAMYHLLFFSRSKAGLTIWNNIKKIAPGGQRSLL